MEIKEGDILLCIVNSNGSIWKGSSTKAGRNASELEKRRKKNRQRKTHRK